MQQHPRGATEHKTGKRKSIGKRKVSDQEEASSSSSQRQQPQPQQSSPPPAPAPPQQQQTISELLAKNQNHDRNYPQQLSPTIKRVRLSASPSESSSSAARSQELRSPGSMYNFSNTDSGAAAGGGAFGKPRPSNATPRQNNFTPHTGAKKLVVKNLRKPRLDQDSYFEKVWSQLDAALGAVFAGGKPETSLEELYKGAENVCRQGKAAVLAKKLQDRCHEHVSGKLRDNLIAKAGGGSNIEMLRAVVETWAMWQSELVCIDQVIVIRGFAIDSGCRLPFAGCSTTSISRSFSTPKSSQLSANWGCSNFDQTYSPIPS